MHVWSLHINTIASNYMLHTQANCILCYCLFISDRIEKKRNRIGHNIVYHEWIPFHVCLCVVIFFPSSFHWTVWNVHVSDRHHMRYCVNQMTVTPNQTKPIAIWHCICEISFSHGSHECDPSHRWYHYTLIHLWYLVDNFCIPIVRTRLT